MKKYLLSLLALFLIAAPVYGLSVSKVIQGGTGTSTPSGILYGDNGATDHLNTVTIGSGCTFVGGTLSCPGSGSSTGQSWEVAGGFLSPTTTIPIAITSTATSTFVGPVSISNWMIPTSTSLQVCQSPDFCQFQVLRTSTSSQVQINAATLVGSLTNTPVDIKGYGTTSPYVISDVLLARQNMTLGGNGIDVTVIKADVGYNPSTLNFASGKSMMIDQGQVPGGATTGGVSNVEISGITFDANGQNSGVSVGTSIHRAMYIRNSSNIKFIGNKITNSISWSTDFDQDNLVWIQKNIVLTGWSNTLNQQDGIHISDISNAWVDHNYIDTVQGGTSGDDCIAVQQFSAGFPVKNVFVSDNLANNCGSRGMILVVHNDDISNVHFDNNNIYGAVHSGLNIYSDSSVSGVMNQIGASGNHIYNVGTGSTGDEDGIRMERDFGTSRNIYTNIKLLGNIIRNVHGTTNACIDVFGGGADFTVNDNQCDEILGTAGIILGSSGNPIKDYTMVGNKINVSDAAPNVKGVYLRDTLHGTVIATELVGHTTGTTYGFYVEGDATNVSSNNDISHSQINAFDNGISEINAGADPNNNQFFDNLYNGVTTNVTKLGVSSTIFGQFAANFGFNTAVPAAFLQLATPNQTGGPNAALGEVFRVDNATFTDSSTAGSGTATGYVTNSLGQETMAATNASVTTTNASNLYIVGAPAKGTNNTVTNTHGIYIAAGSVGAQINSYGLTVNAQTGATNNFAAEFIGGNVGIGTTTPGSLLSIGNTGGINFIPTATSTFSGSANGINITNGCFAIAGTCISGGGGGSGTVGSGTTGQFPYYAGSGTTLTATSTLFVTTASNVGIGTTSPTFKLQIEGNNTSLLKVVNVVGTGSSGGGGLQAQDGVTPTAVDDRLGFLLFGANGASAAGISGAADQAWTLGSAQGAYLKFETTANGGTTRAEKMRLTNGGNLGIGTTSPYTTLGVAGQIVADSIYATSTSGATASSTFAGTVNIGALGASENLVHIQGVSGASYSSGSSAQANAGMVNINNGSNVREALEVYATTLVTAPSVVRYENSNTSQTAIMQINKTNSTQFAGNLLLSLQGPQAPALEWKDTSKDQNTGRGNYQLDSANDQLRHEGRNLLNNGYTSYILESSQYASTTGAVTLFNGTTEGNSNLGVFGTSTAVSSSAYTPRANIFSLTTQQGATEGNLFIVKAGTGLTGIGSSTPYATLSVQSGASTGDAFAVATSSGAAVFGIDNDGHTFTSGPAPAISACGTGTGTVVGDDQSGTITTATAATACTMTFAKAYRNTPTCRVTDNSLVGFADVASISTSAVTFGISSALTGGLLFYDCEYHK